MKLSHTRVFATFAPIAMAALWSGCSASNEPDGGIDSGSDMGADGGLDGGTGGGFGVGFPPPGGGVAGVPWPAEPQFAEDAPAGADQLFQGASAGAGCALEPQDGAMIPKNWLRPRFRMQGGAVAYMVVLSAAEMDNDLVGYGGPGGWKMPAQFWAGIAGYAQQAPIEVTATIRASNGTTFTESVSKFLVSPAPAGGAMVYWASRQSKDHVDSSRLEGFSVGEEGTITALQTAEVSEADLRSYDGYTPKPNTGGEWSDATGAAPGKPSCIGCHTSTPDGAAVAFNDGFPWSGITASIVEETRGQRAEGVTEMGARLLSTPFIGTMAFSAGHWMSGDKRAVASFTTFTPYNNQIASLAEANDLVWIDVEAPGSADFSADPDGLFAMQRDVGWGVISRGAGDSRAAANPAWNPAGDLIAYASTQRVAGGHLGGIQASAVAKQPDTILSGNTEADLYTVPYNGGAGGEAAPVAGAAEPGVAEYYPDFSADGRLLAYNRAGSTQGYIYYRPDGEVYVVPTGGGVPHRLAANDPPLCSGEVSPGVINSWAKWSPSVVTVGGEKHYWVIFSSARTYAESFLVPPDYYTPTGLDTRSSQLYLAAVVEDAQGGIRSYPAVYVWNQTTDTSNLTPAWDEFKIPPVTVK